MVKPLISVIVPIYKVEKYLVECLESLVNQTYNNIEIILVDDGSPDKCPEICDNYKKMYENIKVIHKKNGGLVSARKSGILIATGDYISHVDADDSVELTHFEKIKEAIVKYHADIITTDYGSIINDKKVIYNQPIHFAYLENEELYKITEKMLSIPPFFTFGIFPSVWTKCVKKELAIRYQLSIPNSIVMGEDAAFTYPCIMGANSICHISESGYLYRITPDSITNSYDSNLQKKVLALFQYILNYYDKSSKQLIDYVNFMTIRVVANEIIGNTDLRQAVISINSYLCDSLVKNSLRYGKIPLKNVILLLSVKYKCYFVLRQIKRHWINLR